MIKGSIHQKDVTIKDIYATKITPTKYVTKMLMDLKIDSPTIISRDFNSLLSIIDRIIQKINKERKDLTV